ncbi:hypothetical protein niasHT_037408 [Heterodera trifolii]|uniref:Uncharacterized protein n=1 Tax=Heterodera trifolii TaxID=157864 RepID=A0ABD2J484_9BILA
MHTADESYAESHYGISHAYDAYGRCIIRRSPRAQNGANHWTFANLVIDFPERCGGMHAHETVLPCVRQTTYASANGTVPARARHRITTRTPNDVRVTQWYRISSRTPPYYHAYAIPINASATQMYRCVRHLNVMGPGAYRSLRRALSRRAKTFDDSPPNAAADPLIRADPPPAERTGTSNNDGPPPAERAGTSNNDGPPPAERAGTSNNDGPPPNAAADSLPPSGRAPPTTTDPLPPRGQAPPTTTDPLPTQL